MTRGQQEVGGPNPPGPTTQKIFHLSFDVSARTPTLLFQPP
jgi:hypothetical protein